MSECDIDPLPVPANGQNQAPFHLIRYCTHQAGIQVVINFATTSFIKIGLQGILNVFVTQKPCYTRATIWKGQATSYT